MHKRLLLTKIFALPISIFVNSVKLGGVWKRALGWTYETHFSVSDTAKDERYRTTSDTHILSTRVPPATVGLVHLTTGSCLICSSVLILIRTFASALVWIDFDFGRYSSDFFYHFLPQNVFCRIKRTKQAKSQFQTCCWGTSRLMHQGSGKADCTLKTSRLIVFRSTKLIWHVSNNNFHVFLQNRKPQKLKEFWQPMPIVGDGKRTVARLDSSDAQLGVHVTQLAGAVSWLLTTLFSEKTNTFEYFCDQIWRVGSRQGDRQSRFAGFALLRIINTGEVYMNQSQAGVK